MKNAFVLSMVLGLVSGCYTVDLSDTSYPQERISLRGGPGGREGELVRIVRLKRTHYSGERLSFGLMPGIPAMANDFGGMGGYVPATVLEIFVGPFINAFALATPTLCTLLVEPFTMTSNDRGLSWDAIAMGFAGAYRWRVRGHDDVVIDATENVLVDGGHAPDTTKIRVSKSKDGTKLWHAYPGFRALIEDVVRDGRVDVLFPEGDNEIRRFSPSREYEGCLMFEDRPTPGH